MSNVDYSAWISAVAAAMAAYFAWRAHESSEKAHNWVKDFEEKRLELESEWRAEQRESEDKALREAAERQACAAKDERIRAFLERMRSERPTGIGSSLERGIAALGSDAEIREANEVYKAETGKSVFFGYEELLHGLDAKEVLTEWQIEHSHKKSGIDLEGFLRAKRKAAGLV